MNSICIVGGGTAGWLSAVYLGHELPNTKITLIESPNIPTVGVGESTLGFLNNWLSFEFIGVNEVDDSASCKQSTTTSQLSNV